MTANKQRARVCVAATLVVVVVVVLDKNGFSSRRRGMRVGGGYFSDDIVRERIETRVNPVALLGSIATGRH